MGNNRDTGKTINTGTINSNWLRYARNNDISPIRIKTILIKFHILILFNYSHPRKIPTVLFPQWFCTEPK